MADSGIPNHSNFSFIIIKNNINQLIQSAIPTHFFDTFELDLYIAKAEIIRKKISKLDHHKGLFSPKRNICVCVANKSGVAIQCARHKPLDNMPIESDFFI